MAWCIECWMQNQKTITATRKLDEEDLCDLHYRQALGTGLPATTKNSAPPAVEPTKQAPRGPAQPEADKENITAPPAAAKERETMPPRLCACGCGEATKSNASPYVKGHNPNTKNKAAAAGNGKEKKPRKIRGGQTSNGSEATVTVPLHASHLDALWARLSLREKADKLFPAE